MNHSAHPVETEEVMAYLDGELPPARATEVAAHVEQCAECRALDTDLRRVSEQLAAWHVGAASERLGQQVAAATRESRQKVSAVRPERQWWMPRRWVLALGGGVTVFLLLVAISVPNLLKSRTSSVTPVQFVLSDQQAETSTTRRYARSVDSARPAIGGMYAPRSVPAPAEMASPKYAPEGKPAAPMVVRRANLTVVATEFESARTEMQGLVHQHHGYVSQLEVASPSGAGRSLKATLRIPTDRLDAVIAGLKKLGRVEQESQTAEEVTDQYVDLVARLSNARNTEQRLTEILRQHTGRVTDILQVEKEIARVREEIERMEAQRKSLETRVAFATLDLRLSEEFKVQFQAPPAALTRLRNEFVGGWRSALESAFDLVLFILGSGPTLLLWAAILYFPARFAWRRVKAARKASG